MIARSDQGALPLRREPVDVVSAFRGGARPLRSRERCSWTATIEIEGAVERQRRRPIRCGSSRPSATSSTTRSSTVAAS